MAQTPEQKAAAKATRNADKGSHRITISGSGFELFCVFRATINSGRFLRSNVAAHAEGGQLSPLRLESINEPSFRNEIRS
jgi:hypothetical protein